MFDGFPKEIMFYSLIPVVVLLIVALLVTILMKKKKKIEKFRYNYIIELIFMIIVGIVLPLILGYTIWVIKSFWARQIFFDNIAYIILLIFLTLCLLTLIIWIYLRLYSLVNNVDFSKSEV